MPDTKTAVPIGRTPFLGENPRPAKMFLDTGIEQVAGHASREGHWGWDGASLETVSAIAHDPLLYRPGDFNLYRYVGNKPITKTDSSGLDPQYCSADPGYMGIGTMGNMIKQWEHEAAVAKAKQLCDKIDLCSDGCKNKGCTRESCVASMTQFVEAVRATWILNIFGLPLGPDTCSRWVQDLNSRIPKDFLKGSCISGYNLEEHDLVANLGATTVHWTFYVKMCDGTKINADNGAWGGSDHIFVTTSK